jgi:hypothetical protein
MDLTNSPFSTMKFFIQKIKEIIWQTHNWQQWVCQKQNSTFALVLTSQDLHNIVPNGATTFSITTLIIKTLSVKSLFATLSITTFIIKTLSVWGLFATLSITAFSINGTQHNTSPSIIMLNVTFYLLLCWVLLWRASLCWVSWCRDKCPYIECYYVGCFDILVTFALFVDDAIVQTN